VLPFEFRQTLVQNYQTVKDQISPDNIVGLSTGRNVGVLGTTLRRECDAMIRMLQQPEPENVAELRVELAKWLQRWDQEFGLNAHDFYPEYREFLDAIQYQI